MAKQYLTKTGWQDDRRNMVRSEAHCHDEGRQSGMFTGSASRNKGRYIQSPAVETERDAFVAPDIALASPGWFLSKAHVPAQWRLGMWATSSVWSKSLPPHRKSIRPKTEQQNRSSSWKKRGGLPASENVTVSQTLAVRQRVCALWVKFTALAPLDRNVERSWSPPVTTFRLFSKRVRSMEPQFLRLVDACAITF